MFYFPRNVDVIQINKITCRMKQVKSSFIETNFNDHHKEVVMRNVYV